MSSTDIGTLTALVAFIGIFVEISPLKINPLSAVIQWFGNALNKDTRKQLASISLKLEQVSERIDKIELNDMRSAILDFSNSCMNERRHTKEEIDKI